MKRPDLRPPRLNILTADRERATPGYIFVSPSFDSPYRPDSGPYIFDTDGVSSTLLTLIHLLSKLFYLNDFHLPHTLT